MSSGSQDPTRNGAAPVLRKKTLSSAELGMSRMSFRIDRNQIQTSIANRLEHAPHLWNANKNFLELYQPYIKPEWRFHYFSYDMMKAKYKTLKEQKTPDLMAFERQFYSEIQHVDWFLSANLAEIETDLRTISDSCDFLNNGGQDDPKKKADMGRTVEVFIRKIFDKCKQCEKFYKLNHYVICKVAKKFEKLIEKEETKHDFTPWRDYPSNALFNRTFTGRLDEINMLTAKCVSTYSEKFRQTYPSLAIGELEFVKNKEREGIRTRFYIGVKLGIAISAILWLIVSALKADSTDNFWNQPGLYVYTTVGNLIVFRFCWAANIYIWSQFDVNYISIMQLSDVRPNLLLVLNQTVSQFVLYLINLIVFFEITTSSGRDNLPVTHFLSFGCPSLLIVVFLAYEVYMYFRFRGESLSRGLFTKEVWFDCITAPLRPVTFRANYAADTLTSFTKVISDCMYASCWIVSGAFLYSNQDITAFGTEHMHCNGEKIVLAIGVVQIFTQYIRLAQVSRRYFETCENQFIWNFLKYGLTVVVISYGMTHSTIDNIYLVLVLLSALFKWWWDVVMDWGLFEVLPTWKGGLQQFNCFAAFQPYETPLYMNNNGISRSSSVSTMTNTTAETSAKTKRRGALFLRERLLFPSYLVYYICIFLDLVLRCTWTFSLLPPTFFGTFVGIKFNFFLASLEIFRRSMWGVLRVEYEHLKFVKKGTLGYLELRQKNRKRSVIGAALTEVDMEYFEELGQQKEYQVKTKPGTSPMRNSPLPIISESNCECNVPHEDSELTNIRRTLSSTILSSMKAGSSPIPMMSSSPRVESARLYSTSNSDELERASRQHSQRSMLSGPKEKDVFDQLVDFDHDSD